VSGRVEYLFNYLGHVHRYLSMHGMARADLGLTYSEVERFGEMIRDVDSLPGSQSPEMSRMHAMCSAGTGSAECGLVTSRYIERQWEARSIDGLAGLVHLDQDSSAPMHRGGQSYSGFGLSNAGEALDHFWSDRMPDAATRAMLINRTTTLIRNYNDYCGGCVKNALSGGPR